MWRRMREKGSLPKSERLKFVHCLRIGEGLRWQGSDDIDTSACRLGGDLSGLYCDAKDWIGNLETGVVLSISPV
jgi:hypothetical protein